MANEIKWLKAAFSKLAYDSGLTQYELADKVGVSQPQINRLLNPKNEFGRLETWIQIAAAFKMDLIQLLNYGRSLSEAVSEAPPSPEVAGYLEKARAALEGPEAELFKQMINKFAKE